MELSSCGRDWTARGREGSAERGQGEVTLRCSWQNLSTADDGEVKRATVAGWRRESDQSASRSDDP